MTTTAPPAWAVSLVEHRAGLRWLILSLLEEEAGRPLPALDKLLAVIPDDERKSLVEALRWADENDGLCAFDCAIDNIVAAYETHIAAAYAPPLSDDEVHDCHTEVTPAMLARAELHPLGDPHRCDVDARIDELVALLNDGPDLFGAAANYATAAALRAGLPRRVPGASLAANPPRDVDQPGTEAAA